jgi:hypothetical protein
LTPSSGKKIGICGKELGHG